MLLNFFRGREFHPNDECTATSHDCSSNQIAYHISFLALKPFYVNVVPLDIIRLIGCGHIQLKTFSIIVFEPRLATMSTYSEETYQVMDTIKETLLIFEVVEPLLSSYRII